MATILEGDEPVGLCSFFLLRSVDEVRALHHRPLWTLPEDHESGPIAYIDVLIAPTWSRDLKQALIQAVTTLHPEVAWGVWYRSKGDRDVRYTCRVGE